MTRSGTKPGRGALFAVAFGLVAAPGARGGAPAEAAERIFLNGRVWTADEARPRAEALAVRGESLVAVGTRAEIERHKGPETVVVDLAGAFVAPGFGDGHLHLMEGSTALSRLDLVGATTAADVRARVAAYAARRPAGWIRGRGWAYGDFPPAGPDRSLLDVVSPDRPVFVYDRDGHSALANSAALREARIGRTTPDPANGIIVRDATGEATGLLKEAATSLVEDVVPKDSPEERYEALKRGVATLASYGLTAVHDAGVDEQDLPLFDRLRREGGLSVRVAAAVPMVNPTPETLARYREYRARWDTADLRVASVKGMVDGVVDARTAAMLEPYVGGGTGLPNWTTADLDRTVAAYDREGFQVLLHACGDRAVRMALDAFERAARTNGTRGRRHRVEHAEVVSPLDRARFGPMGVIASTQALFANPDKTTLENYAVLLGPARAAQANAFKRFDEAGAVQAFGSDWPVFSAEVLRGIYCAVTRTTPEGTPAGGWYPENRVSAEAALRHFTRDAAYATSGESTHGILRAGMAADFVVFSHDILAEPANLLKTRVLRTVKGGRDTYAATAREQP